MAERRQHYPSKKEKTESWRPPVIMAGSGIIMELSRQYPILTKMLSSAVLEALTVSIFFTVKKAMHNSGLFSVAYRT